MTDQRDLIVLLEGPLSDYASYPAKVREILIAGLTWETDYWAELAVRWIEGGAPIDAEICELLDQFQNKPFPQNLRHRARAASRRFRRSDSNV
jgi:hypothetical protein